MKKINNILFILIFIFILSSCSTNKKSISICYYNKSDVFIELLDSAIVKNLEGYDIKKYDGESNQIIQNESLVNALNAKTDLVLMNPYDRFSAKSIVDKCKITNTPIIFFNREPLLSSLKDYEKCVYVGPDAKKQGKLQAEIVARYFSNPKALNSNYDKNHDNVIQVLILKGEQGHQDAEKRTRANIDTLEELGYNIEVVSIEICKWDRTTAYNAVERVYTSLKKEPEVILSNNDEMAIGAANYINMAKNGVDIPIIGVDATENGKNAVNSGLLAATIVNDAIKQGEIIAELSKNILETNKLDLTKYEIYNEKFIYVESYEYVK